MPENEIYIHGWIKKDMFAAKKFFDAKNLNLFYWGEANQWVIANKCGDNDNVSIPIVYFELVNNKIFYFWDCAKGEEVLGIRVDHKGLYKLMKGRKIVK